MVIVLSFYVLTANNWTFLNAACAISSITLSVVGTHSKQMLYDIKMMQQKVFQKKTVQGLALSFVVGGSLIFLRSIGHHHFAIKDLSDRYDH